MKSNNTVIAVGLAVVSIVALVVVFLVLRSEEEASVESPDTTPTQESSELTQLPDESNVQSVSLVEQSVSFFVPDSLVETNEPEVYKQYQAPDNCEYLAHDDELMVVAYTDAACVDLQRFEDNGSNEISGQILDSFSKEGRSGDVLLYERVELGNNVTLGFFYKEKFAARVVSEVADVISSFEME